MPAYLLARPVAAECSTCPRHPLFPVIPRGFGVRTHGCDKVVKHRPKRCGGCGKPLRGGEVTGVERRQVIGIPAREGRGQLEPAAARRASHSPQPNAYPASLPGFELRSTDRDVV